MVLKEEVKISDDITLEPYQEEKHLKTLEEMRNDPELRHFLYRTRELNIINREGNPVGYVYFDQLHYLKDSVSLTIGLKSEYRSHSREDKNGIGQHVISAISHYLLDELGFDAVVLETRPLDARMQRVAERTQFTRDDYLEMKFYEEGYHDVPYVRRRERQ